MTTFQIVLIKIRFIYDECKLYKTLKMQILFIFILQLFPVIVLFTALIHHLDDQGQQSCKWGGCYILRIDRRGDGYRLIHIFYFN